MKRLSDQTLYELLEVRPDAPQDDVRAAIERARAIFGPGSLAMYSLMSTDEALLLNRRIEEAWATLLDPEARARYDASLVASKGEGATAHPVAPWTAIPPVIPARHDPKARPAAPEHRHTPAPPSAASIAEPAAGAEAGSVAGPEAVAGSEAEAVPEAVPEAVAEPVPGPTPEPVAAAEPAPEPEPDAPTPPQPRKPLLLVQTPARTPPPAAAPPAPARAPIRLERAVSVPPAMTPVPQAVSASPRAEEPIPTFAEDAPWTGEMLRKVREARGLPLQIIAERTKVTRHHLENIEGDRFKLLPAPVYLRGILLGLARELRLDGQKVARSYLERMDAALSPPPSTPGTKR